MTSEAFADADISSRARMAVENHKRLVDVVDGLYMTEEQKGSVPEYNPNLDYLIIDGIRSLNNHGSVQVDPEKYTAEGRAREIRNINRPCYWLTAIFPFTHGIGAACAFASGDPDNYLGGVVLATVALAAFPVMMYVLRRINSGSMDVHLQRLHDVVEACNARLLGR